MEALDTGAIRDRADTVVDGALLDDIRKGVLTLRDQVDLLYRQANTLPDGNVAATPAMGSLAFEAPRPRTTVYARCLGAFAMYLDEAELSPGKSRAAQEICRYLVAHAGKRVASEDLIDLLWPDAEVEPASHRLHVAVSALRHSLERSGLKVALVQFEEGSYFVHRDAVMTDCDLFNRWYDSARAHVQGHHPAEAASAFKKALSLYTGDYFADLPYAEWTHDARAHYMERRLSALTFLCEHAAREGNYLEVVEYARAMLGTDNLREVAHRYLMRAHYQLGQRGVAIRQFNTCCELLRRELGVGPSRLTRALYEAIRDDHQLPEDRIQIA